MARRVELRSVTSAIGRSGAEFALSVSRLRVETYDGDAIVEDVSLSIRPGEILGLVGESGSGKTTTALATMGYEQPGVHVVAGETFAAGQRLGTGSDSAMRSLRGRVISYVPQNPASALNPAVRVGAAVQQMLEVHMPGAFDKSAVAERFSGVGLPSDREFLRRFPHQLSGGQQQRVCIAVATACQPPVVVLDEPTTGLDVSTQALILDELARLRRERNTAMLYVTHDLAVVAQIADRVAVMYSGRIVEEGPTLSVLRDPCHPYTNGLLASIPDHVHPTQLAPMPGAPPSIEARPTGCAFEPRCALRIDACSERVPDMVFVAPERAARCIRSQEVERHVGLPVRRASEIRLEARSDVLTVSRLSAHYRNRGRTQNVVADVSFAVERTQCVALVGESGSGKTTIARTIVGLHQESGGSVELSGMMLARSARRRTREQRRRIQFISQNPALALNPRQTVVESIARPAVLLRGMSGKEARKVAVEFLERVRLLPQHAHRYPAELSGGEQQRVAIARALIARPDLLVCDEITSALDVSVQAVVLELLRELRDTLSLSVLFISHDVGVVSEIADFVLVLSRGSICESGPVSVLLRAPQSDHAQQLLDAAPSVSRALEGVA